MTRILLTTDAWHPQVNGVVSTLTELAGAVGQLGATIRFLHPGAFRTLPMPGYPEIRLSLATRRAVARAIREHDPDHMHIATEGPIGLAARAACRDRGLRFTTSYHTRFPEYLAARLPVPMRLSYAALRRFHNAGTGIMVSTGSVQAELAARGFSPLMRWSRGVDAALFRPRASRGTDLQRPVFLTVARLAVEKNIEAFLQLDLPGTKVVVGDGPARPALQAAFPQARFLGMLRGEALAEAYAAADVFVFPSRTDTFGLVLLEALASGLPVAAYPVPGPADVLAGSEAGALSEDLRAACLRALDIPREAARAHALRFTWEASARQFLANVAHAHAPLPTGPKHP